MKAFIISSVCMLLLLCSWWGFSYFADNTLHELMDIGEKEIAVAIKDENWVKAKSSTEELTDKWHAHKKVYAFFFRTSAINDTDFSIARVAEYIDSEDRSNSSGEISCILEQLKFLHGNEILTLENLF